MQIFRDGRILKKQYIPIPSASVKGFDDEWANCREDNDITSDLRVLMDFRSPHAFPVGRRRKSL
jgi:hypothetical protein